MNHVIGHISLNPTVSTLLTLRKPHSMKIQNGVLGSSEGRARNFGAAAGPQRKRVVEVVSGSSMLEKSGPLTVWHPRRSAVARAEGIGSSVAEARSRGRAREGNGCLG
jgi:hypothetical protein